MVGLVGVSHAAFGSRLSRMVPGPTPCSRNTESMPPLPSPLGLVELLDLDPLSSPYDQNPCSLSGFSLAEEFRGSVRCCIPCANRPIITTTQEPIFKNFSCSEAVIMSGMLEAFRIEIIGNGNIARYRPDDPDTLILESRHPNGQNSFWISTLNNSWYIGLWSGRVYIISNGSTSDYFKACTDLLKHEKITYSIDKRICELHRLTEVDYDTIAWD